MTEEIKDFQIDDTMTAGEMLRIARTTGRRKREIQTISKQLCIREEFLQALEDGNYNVLPETVYILGFARNYAMELGLDPDMVVEKIKREMGINQPLDMVVPLREETTENKEHTARAKMHYFDNFKQTGVFKFVAKRWKWFVGGFVAFVLLILGLMAILPSERAADVVPEVPSVAEVAVVNIEPEYRQAVREKFGTENRENTRIVFQAVKESWVKIEDARAKTVFSRVLVPGDVYFTPNGNKYKATLGDANGIDIWVDKTLVVKAGAKSGEQGALDNFIDKKLVTRVAKDSARRVVSLDADGLSGAPKSTK